MLTPNNFRSEGSQFFSNYMNPEQPLDQGSFGKLCFTLRSIKSKCWQLQVRNQAIQLFRPSRSLVPSIYLVSHSDWQIRQRRAPSEAPTTGKIYRTRKKKNVRIWNISSWKYIWLFSDDMFFFPKYWGNFSASQLQLIFYLQPMTSWVPRHSTN